MTSRSPLPHLPLSRLTVALLAAGYLLAPWRLSDFWLSVLIYGGIAAIGAVGLNLLTGYTGQVSLGHAAFLGAGAYTAGYVGVDLGWPLPAWLVAAALAGGALGALVGPAALRLRGHYLGIITLGLVLLAQHIFQEWNALTGGATGRPTTLDASIAGVDFNELTVLGQPFTREQSWFWLVWALTGLAALAVANIVRTRPGRAMQAVRDREVAAEMLGVSVTRYKIGAFVVASALAAVAGALQAGFQQYVSPSEWSLLLSIQFLAMIIVGGLGSTTGAVLGALFVGALPHLIDELSAGVPWLAGEQDSLISVFALNQIVFGLLIVLFLTLEPHGLAALWVRLRTHIARTPRWHALTRRRTG
ncbi:branched-chain amino acid ABC transporter permease [Streptomyces luteolus]|uniref:Branched-chain amino acid ABC transporter permease n=1 Tax=Streptomyces luteolus TaxID=3043615 RepID=A0ABT6SPS3_9ACTN|nr:branched-chain amino acid ABC transporter permease [Streptomyces sp. B-S-A12]MDI3417602.1 branched-chain amino acid ABC transporter permease [Streptomyces sp. B-S-A12]